jgi:hypothetical protein
MTEELMWELNVDLPDPSTQGPSTTFEGCGQPHNPVNESCSARFFFDLVFPLSLRAIILRETNRYGIFFQNWCVRSGTPGSGKALIPWVHLDDSELCVFLGIVVVK